MSLKQQRKKQARDRAVKEKLQQRRLLRADDRKKADYERRIQAMFKQKSRPIVRQGTTDTVAERDAEIRTQLEHNMEILRVLEEEMDREEADRKAVNQRLEEEGLVTLRDKVEALHGEARGHEDASLRGAAEVSFTPNQEGR